MKKPPIGGFFYITQITSTLQFSNLHPAPTKRMEIDYNLTGSLSDFLVPCQN